MFCWGFLYIVVRVVIFNTFQLSTWCLKKIVKESSALKTLSNLYIMISFVCILLGSWLYILWKFSPFWNPVLLLRILLLVYLLCFQRLCGSLIKFWLFLWLNQKHQLQSHQESPHTFHTKFFLINIRIRKIITISFWCHLGLLQFVLNSLPKFTVLLMHWKVCVKLKNCTKNVQKHKTFKNCPRIENPIRPGNSLIVSIIAQIGE